MKHRKSKIDYKQMKQPQLQVLATNEENDGTYANDGTFESEYEISIQESDIDSSENYSERKQYYHQRAFIDVRTEDIPEIDPNRDKN